MHFVVQTFSDNVDELGWYFQNIWKKKNKNKSETGNSSQSSTYQMFLFIKTFLYLVDSSYAT